MCASSSLQPAEAPTSDEIIALSTQLARLEPSAVENAPNATEDAITAIPSETAVSAMPSSVRRGASVRPEVERKAFEFTFPGGQRQASTSMIRCVSIPACRLSSSTQTPTAKVDFFVQFLYSMGLHGRVRISENLIKGIIYHGSVSKRQLFHQVASLAITVKSQDLYTVAEYALANMGEYKIDQARA